MVPEDRHESDAVSRSCDTSVETRWTRFLADDCALTPVNEITALGADGARRPIAAPAPRTQTMKPRSLSAKRPMFGNTTGISGGPDAVPRRQRRRVLLDRGGRDPAAAVVGVARAIQLQHREDRAVRPGHAEEVATAHRAADDEVVVAPRVIRADDAGAGTGGLERAAEVGQRERGDLLVQPEFDGRRGRTRPPPGSPAGAGWTGARPDSGACRSPRAGRRRSGASGRAPAWRR